MVCGSVANLKPYQWKKGGTKQENYVFVSAAYQAIIEVQPAGEAGLAQLMDVVPTTITCYTTKLTRELPWASQKIRTPWKYQNLK